MKKTAVLLLTMALLAGLLAGCGQSVTPREERDPPAPAQEERLSARELAEAVLPHTGREEALELEALNGDGDPDRLGAYIEAVCGLEAGGWEDAAVIRGTGVSAFEIVVLRLADEDAAGKLEPVLAEYLAAREGAFTGYAPDEAEMAANGQVRREERTVGLFICPDPEGATAAFSAAYHGEALPAPAEPEPAQSFAVSAAMQPLADVLAEVCRGEINEITAAGGMVASASPNATEGFPETVEQTYGIAPEQWTDGFTLQSVLSDVSLFELAVFRMADQDTAVACMEQLDAHEESLRERFYTVDGDGVRNVLAEHEEDYAYVGGAYIVRNGEYLGLFICRDAEKVTRVFQNALNSMRREEPEETPDGPPADTPPVIEIMEGVSVTEVTWRDAEGEPDPDHPGRIRYVPTGNERMAVYDTSAIVSAWRAGDPSGLPDDERAIYDSAGEVLAEILRDGMSDLEKEVEIYDWILRNVQYDGSHMDALEETGRDAYTPYGGLVNRSAVCLGYASTFQLLMELAGVECLTVAGVGQSTEDHAWNLVKLNGEWYGVDVTWEWSFYESGMMNGREWRFFNVTSDYLARTNHQWDYDAVPEATAEDYGAPGAA